MRALMVAATLLGMVVSLQAKEADTLRGPGSSDAAVKQFVSNLKAANRGASPREQGSLAARAVISRRKLSCLISAPAADPGIGSRPAGSMVCF